MPLVYGGDGVAGVTDQANPSAIGYGAPAMEVLFSATILADKHQMFFGCCKLHIYIYIYPPAPCGPPG